MLDLNKDVKYVKTVGPNRVKLLNKLNIYCILNMEQINTIDIESESTIVITIFTLSYRTT